MCLSCGCGKLDDNHGDDRHITKRDIEEAAQAANMSAQQVVQNIEKGTGSGSMSAASGMNSGSGSQRQQ